ncbi:hypothetical protein ACWF9B_22030 [Streptomyces sp. NPDC055089]
MPEWFGDDGADTEAMSETLMDDRAWQVFRVPFDGGHTAIVVYRNLLGDFGIDYLLVHPDWSRARALARFDGDWAGPGLTWKQLAQIAVSADLASTGVHEPAERWLLLLPVLCQTELPADAQAQVAAPLEAIGAPIDSIRNTARALLDGRARGGHEGLSGFPLSGARSVLGAGSPELALPRALRLSEAQHEGLVRALN